MKSMKLTDVTLGPRNAPALVSGLNIDILPGEIVTIMGRSGTGKSTLLAFVGGHLDPDFVATGTISVDGRDVTTVPAERRGIGVLFQDDLLFPHLSVGENLAFGLPPFVVGKAERRRHVEEALARAELTGFSDRDPATLSGGQRARVALMRTLLARPKALLLDEPFSKLDADLRDEMRRFVFSHVREQALPVLLVTHDIADAAAAQGPILSL